MTLDTLRDRTLALYRLAFALCVVPLLLAATCKVPVFGTGPDTASGGAPSTGGTGGTVVVDAGTSETGGEASATGGALCRYVPSAKTPRPRTARIVGGTPSPVGAFPWMVALETEGGWQYCGGTVIADRWVLTAAHCQVQPREYAHIGTVDLGEPSRRIEIAEVRNHPNWTSVTSGHDVAVLRLAEDSYIVPIVLAADVVPGDTAIAIGWGATVEGGSTTPVQRHVNVPLVSREDCFKAYPGQITSDMLCAGASGLDSCQGDSGGPLVIWNGGYWQLGVTSWGVGCGRPDAPGVYISVPAVRDWIEACAR